MHGSNRLALGHEAHRDGAGRESWRTGAGNGTPLHQLSFSGSSLIARHAPFAVRSRRRRTERTLGHDRIAARQVPCWAMSRVALVDEGG
jgi:hypothetical protein